MAKYEIFSSRTIFFFLLYRRKLPIYIGRFFVYVLFLPIYNRRKRYTTVYAVAFFNLFLIDIYIPPCYYIIVPGEQRKKINWCCRHATAERKDSL